MHVKICVDCGEEYRPEVAVCADCGGRLEERSADGERAAMPEPPPSERVGDDADADFTEAILHAERASNLRSEADRLIEAGIEFRMRPSPAAGYRLVVAAEDRDRALALLGLLADPASVSDEGRSCPVCGTAVAPAVAECPECGLTVGDEPEAED